MNTAELTALHEETISEIRNVRTLENITRRAARLFDDRYTAQVTMNGLYVRCYRVTSPEGHVYTVKVSRTPAAPGTAFGSKCSCPCFEKLTTCKHLQACEMELAREDAQVAALEAAQDNDDDPYAEF